MHGQGSEMRREVAVVAVEGGVGSVAMLCWRLETCTPTAP